ncbi:MAG: Prolyl tripeptidyl peptidase precursor [Planctomycetota bacterium]|jgi:dipeptidyl-peptidase-4
MILMRWLRQAACALLLAATHAHADGFARYDDLPNADRVAEVRRALREVGRQGRVDDVRWEEEAVLFRADDGWKRLDLADGSVREASEPAPEPPPSGPVDPPAGRARQRTRATSPDRAWRAEHRDGGVHLVEVATGASEPVIQPSTDMPGVVYGTADWVYGEELDQNDAMWWSPDSRFLAFYAFDISRVPTYELPRGWAGLRTESAPRSYPKAGDPNALVGLMVLDRRTGRVATVDVGSDPEQYVYAVRFAPGGQGLLFHRTNRRQDRLQVCLADPVTGASRVMVEETQPTFQENRPLMRFLADGDRFLWGSERTGFRNLELRSLSAPGQVTVLTRHDEPVDKVVQVDEDRGVVWYTAFSGTLPMLPQLHQVRLDGADGRRLTTPNLGWSGFRVSPDGSRFVAIGQSPTRPPRTCVFNADGSCEPAFTLAQSDLRAFESLRMPPPELFTCTAADGSTPLFGVLFKPPDFDPARRYPLVVDVYGGPHSQAITGRFDPGPAERAFGCVIMKVDNRGTTGRGKAFEGATYLRLGGPDVDDQAAAVRAITSRPWVDPDRVGIFGHSYGGTMAASCMIRHPQLFQAAVAGAPVTDWRHYDTIYTERWMRTPNENPDGYRAACLPCDAAELQGHLLLVHGLEDDNVHPSNTLQLAKALQDADIPFDMLIFPDADHSVGAPAYRSARWSFLFSRLGMGDALPDRAIATGMDAEATDEAGMVPLEVEKADDPASEP